MNRSALYRGLFLLPLLLLSACAATPPAPEDHYYRLIVSDMPTANATVTIPGVLKIDAIKAYGIYRERALLYSEQAHPEALQQHHYHYWIDTPTRLIRDQLVDFLRASHVAEQVAGAQVALSGDLRLRLTLKKFERVVSVTGGAGVRVALDGVITSADGKPIKIVSYSRELPIKENSITASVTAFSQALNEIYFEVLKDLRSH
jgi:ABC-type uncharacterized transport system auxiliary subunit